MATRLYFHAAASGIAGTLPTAEQSALTSNKDVDAQTVNRSMDTSVGVSQTSLVLTSLANVNANDYYFSKFVSPLIYSGTIDANTWTYAFAASESTVAANFPVSGTNKACYVNCYVWRPSNGSKVGTILDGNTAATVDEGAAATEVYHIVTFSGSQVTGVQAGDVIVFEVWFETTQANATARTDTYFYDGTTVSAENATASNAAAYIETPQTIQLVPPNNVEISVPSETVSSSDGISRLSAKWKRMVSIERWF